MAGPFRLTKWPPCYCMAMMARCPRTPLGKKLSNSVWNVRFAAFVKLDGRGDHGGDEQLSKVARFI